MSGKKILVVEDNLLNRRLVHDVLGRGGHAVIEATSIAEGRAALEKEIPDAVLLDIGLPDGSGERLLEQIRAEPRWAHLRVMAVTAYAMVGDRERLLGIGFDSYVSKPINTRTFTREVEQMMEKAR